MLRDYIHSLESKQRSSSEQVFIVRVNFGKAMRGGGSEMDGIRSAEIRGRRGRGEDCFEVIEYGIGQVEKAEISRINISARLSHKSQKL